MGISESANQINLENEIRQSVLKELRSSISEDVELGRLRIVKGRNIIIASDDYIITNVVMTSRSGRSRVNFSVYLMNKNPNADKNERKVIVEASYDILMDIFVSTRPLARGTTLTDKDFHILKQKSSRLPIGADSK